MRAEKPKTLAAARKSIDVRMRALPSATCTLSLATRSGRPKSSLVTNRPGTVNPVARPAVPTRNGPSLARGPRQDHHDPASSRKMKPLANCILAREITHRSVNGDVKAQDPHRERGKRKGLVKPELEVTRTPLPREKKQYIEHPVSEGAMDMQLVRGKSIPIFGEIRGMRGNIAL